jgi:hypothetical protein
MKTENLAINRRVIWRGLRARIVDIRWHGLRATVRIVVLGGHEHWSKPEDLEEQP